LRFSFKYIEEIRTRNYNLQIANNNIEPTLNLSDVDW